MIVSELTGGLGNQLFQYAAAKSLSLYQNNELLLDVSAFNKDHLPELEVPRNFELNKFEGVTDATIIAKDYAGLNIDYLLKKNLLQKLLPNYKRHLYKEPFYHFDNNFFKAGRNVYLRGFWQSEKYFQPYTKEIKSCFTIKHEYIQDKLNFASQLIEENSIAIHIRRGDYLRLPVILEWHGVLDVDYYSAALQRIKKEKLNAPALYFFSDDPEWVEENLWKKWGGIIVSKEIKTNAIEDFYLMSQCKHNIIANSSFSWWAAWLNANEHKKVIAPKKWFGKAPNDTKDLYPADWIIM